MPIVERSISESCACGLVAPNAETEARRLTLGSTAIDRSSSTAITVVVWAKRRFIFASGCAWQLPKEVPEGSPCSLLAPPILPSRTGSECLRAVDGQPHAIERGRAAYIEVIELRAAEADIGHHFRNQDL